MTAAPPPVPLDTPRKQLLARFIHDVWDRGLDGAADARLADRLGVYRQLQASSAQA